MNGRVYDPTIGRFMSVDPVFQFPENTQSLNPYSYVLNNPLSFTDPTGYGTCDLAKAANCPLPGAGEKVTITEKSTPTGSHIATTKTAGTIEGTKSGWKIVGTNGATADISLKVVNQGPKTDKPVTSRPNVATAADAPRDDTGHNADQIERDLVESGDIPDYQSMSSENGVHHRYDNETQMDCPTSISSCTLDTARDGNTRYPAPGASGTPVTSRKQSEVTVGPFSAGKVEHLVGTGNLYVVNVTLEGHVFYQGYVLRVPEQHDNKIFIRTIGMGINQAHDSRLANSLVAAANWVAGTFGFASSDASINRYMLNQSQEGHAYQDQKDWMERASARYKY